MNHLSHAYIRRLPFMLADRSMNFQVNFWRGFVDISRNPVLLLAHWVMAIVMGVGLGFIFFDVKKDFAGKSDR